MDNYLIEQVKAVTPKFNPSVANGLAVEHMMSRSPETGKLSSLAYIDRLIQINQELFPEGLEYVGSQVCTPIEEYRELTKEYNSSRTANIARWDVFMIKLQFKFQGELLYPRYVRIPYVNDGGLLYLNGALYNISPVLTDVGFSVLRGSLFIPFRRTRLTFNRTDYHFYADDRREIVYVIWSIIHQEMRKISPRRDLNKRRYVETSLTHYFFCRYGVKETFRRWGGADLLIGWRKDFPTKEFPREQYTRFQSDTLIGRHPTGDLCLLVPKTQDTDFVRMLVGGFFYVVDTFPDWFQSLDYVDSIVQWRRLLGRLVFGDYKNDGSLQEDIDLHMDTMETYLDGMTREDLRARDINVKNIWELFHAIMTDLAHYFVMTTTDEASMYNKRLVVLRYVMEELNNAISMFSFGFQSQRKGDKEWTREEIENALKKHFRITTAIAKLTGEHGEINTVSYPGDNKMLRITCMLIPQDKARSKSNFSKGLITDESRKLHASIAEVGQFNNQPKNNPDGRGRIGTCVMTEVGGNIRRNPERKQLIDETQRRYRRM